MKGRQICTRCFSIADPGRPPNGNLLLEVLAWLLTPVADALYSTGRSVVPRHVCPSCGGQETMVELGSDRGRELVLDHHGMGSATGEERRMVHARYGM